ncbi:MAG TPA: DUF480 domain-containing protein [Verrucomicrobiales bacterium]|nr:DUF480 domain-containing protein [Verrucomicrobiales bacterium]
MPPDSESASPVLSFAEARVLGCLIEKEMSTPEYYPLTLAALTAACNQRSNRDPVVQWDEKSAEAAMTGLRRQRLGALISQAGARVPKYKHTLERVFDSLDPGMKAVLCELLLRNVQTLSELRSRTDRLHAFPSSDAVEDSVMKLVNYGAGPLASVLPPGSGRRVKCYAHLLCGAVDAQTPVHAGQAVEIPPSEDWKAKVETELAGLRREIEQLKTALGV